MPEIVNWVNILLPLYLLKTFKYEFVKGKQIFVCLYMWESISIPMFYASSVFNAEVVSLNALTPVC